MYEDRYTNYLQIWQLNYFNVYKLHRFILRKNPSRLQPMAHLCTQWKLESIATSFHSSRWVRQRQRYTKQGGDLRRVVDGGGSYSYTTGQRHGGEVNDAANLRGVQEAELRRRWSGVAQREQSNGATLGLELVW